MVFHGVVRSTSIAANHVIVSCFKRYVQYRIKSHLILCRKFSSVNASAIDNDRSMYEATATSPTATSTATTTASVPSAIAGVRLNDVSTSSLRTSFINFFSAENHAIIRSSSLIPNHSNDDSDLMFTNAGMVQFKDIFAAGNTDSSSSDCDYLVPSEKCAVTVQRCVRAGGKHNDLSDVGYTSRHHTFFEMLGNFSFGAYGKCEAITLAWRYLTQCIGLPIEHLNVTVYEEDNESYNIWLNEVGIPATRIQRLGLEDNYWSLGDNAGPCGPCTEIFWRCPSSGIDTEVWNLVFMDSVRVAVSPNEVFSPLKHSRPTGKTMVDTGMGLERLAAVLQGAPSNFHIDAFAPAVTAVRDIVLNTDAKMYNSSNFIEAVRTDAASVPHVRIIVDHLRAAAALMADGVSVSNVGRGYVLRRIIRRATCSAGELGISEPFLSAIWPHMLVGLPEYARPVNEAAVRERIEAEEIAFFLSMKRGIRFLNKATDSVMKSAGSSVPADIVFLLFESYGFPLDISYGLLDRRGLTVDKDVVGQLLKDQKERSRLAQRKKGDDDKKFPRANFLAWQEDGLSSRFLKDETTVKCCVTAVTEEFGKRFVVVDASPFYGASGGQIGDHGSLGKWQVVDSRQPCRDFTALQLSHPAGLDDKVLNSPRIGDVLVARLDVKRRRAATIHHSATHLMHAALVAILGGHIRQAGSYVGTDSLRFDFTHHNAVTSEQLRQVEEWVYKASTSDVPVTVETLPLDEALAGGAKSFFGDRYGSEVNVVRFGEFSSELCGGTHVSRSSEIYPFKIVSEGSIAYGTRRITAMAGEAAVRWLEMREAKLRDVADILDATPDRVIDVASAVMTKLQREKQVTKSLLKFVVNSPVSTSNVRVVMGGISVSLHIIPEDLALIKGFADMRAVYLRDMNEKCESSGGHVSIIVNQVDGGVITISDENNGPNCGVVLKLLNDVLEAGGGGKGGGKKSLARGRLISPGPEAIKGIERWFEGIKHL